MNAQTQNSRDYGFVLGLVTGSVIGAGLALWLAPKAAGEVRDRVKASAQRIGIDLKHKSDDLRDQVRATAQRLGADLKHQGDDLRDHVADAVVRGAHDVEQIAVAVKADRRPV